MNTALKIAYDFGADALVAAVEAYKAGKIDSRKLHGLAMIATDEALTLRIDVPGESLAEIIGDEYDMKDFETLAYAHDLEGFSNFDNE
jgi:hypothetical protein